MVGEFVPSDIALLDLLRKNDSLTVAKLAELMGVTATAIRQRLSRLLGQGVVERVSQGNGRGRPSYYYRLSAAGRRKAGANFGDLALALWDEMRSIQDIDVRRGLIKRIASRLAEQYLETIEGNSLDEKLEAIAELFAERRIPFSVEQSENDLPALSTFACPYPGIAEQDRAICAMEKLMFESLIGHSVNLTECRLDGGSCCTFEIN